MPRKPISAFLCVAFSLSALAGVSASRSEINQLIAKLSQKKADFFLSTEESDIVERNKLYDQLSRSLLEGAQFEILDKNPDGDTINQRTTLGGTVIPMKRASERSKEHFDSRAKLLEVIGKNSALTQSFSTYADSVALVGLPRTKDQVPTYLTELGEIVKGFPFTKRAETAAATLTSLSLERGKFGKLQTLYTDLVRDSFGLLKRVQPGVLLRGAMFATMSDQPELKSTLLAELKSRKPSVFPLTLGGESVKSLEELEAIFGKHQKIDPRPDPPCDEFFEEDSSYSQWAKYEYPTIKKQRLLFTPSTPHPPDLQASGGSCQEAQAELQKKIDEFAASPRGKTFMEFAGAQAKGKKTRLGPSAKNVPCCSSGPFAVKTMVVTPWPEYDGKTLEENYCLGVEPPPGKIHCWFRTKEIQKFDENGNLIDEKGQRKAWAFDLPGERVSKSENLYGCFPQRHKKEVRYTIPAYSEKSCYLYFCRAVAERPVIKIDSLSQAMSCSGDAIPPLAEAPHRSQSSGENPNH